MNLIPLKDYIVSSEYFSGDVMDAIIDLSQGRAGAMMYGYDSMEAEIDIDDLAVVDDINATMEELKAKFVGVNSDGLWRNMALNWIYEYVQRWDESEDILRFIDIEKFRKLSASNVVITGGGYVFYK